MKVGRYVGMKWYEGMYVCVYHMYNTRMYKVIIYMSCCIEPAFGGKVRKN